MEGEAEYLETDVRKRLVQHLKRLSMDVEPVDPGTLSLEKKPYYSYYYAGSAGMVDNMGCLKVKGRNFDYIHIIRRG